MDEKKIGKKLIVKVAFLCIFNVLIRLLKKTLSDLALRVDKCCIDKCN